MNICDVILYYLSITMSTITFTELWKVVAISIVDYLS
jgi:hypothetical protein